MGDREVTAVGKRRTSHFSLSLSLSTAFGEFVSLASFQNQVLFMISGFQGLHRGLECF